LLACLLAFLLYVVLLMRICRTVFGVWRKGFFVFCKQFLDIGVGIEI
jgi:hypothetical protein